MNRFRTDMAVELAKEQSRPLPGLRIETKQLPRDIEVTVVDIEDDESAGAIGKPIGRYVTIDAQDIASGELEIGRGATQAFADELTKVIDHGSGNASYLVVGVGNRDITADSVGPFTAEHIIVTRHLLRDMKDILPNKATSACAIAPGVLGETGLETGEVIRALVDKIQPRMVIAIDSLAAQSPRRIASSIQVANTGIAPGSGLGNNRPKLDQDFLGVPVIAVGVPMVVYASTIAMEALEAVGDSLNREPDKRTAFDTLQEVYGDMVVTPKDVDALAKNCAYILSTGINMAIHQMSYEEATAYSS